jgi:methionine salvage enolase-phosphatase E1
MRKFLVVLDDTRECLNAMRFAAMRAANTRRRGGDPVGHPAR